MGYDFRHHEIFLQIDYCFIQTKIRLSCAIGIILNEYLNSEVFLKYVINVRNKDDENLTNVQ